MDPPMKPPKKPAAPPPKRAYAEIEPFEVEKLAGLQLTQRAMSGWFGVSYQTLANRLRGDPLLRAAYERGRAAAQISIVQKMYLQAMGNPDDPKSGNPILLMFLAKNMCRMDGQGLGRGTDAASYEIDLTPDTGAGDKAAIDGAAAELSSWTTDQMREYVETGKEPEPGMVGIENHSQDRDTYRAPRQGEDIKEQQESLPAVITTTRVVDSDGESLGPDPIDIDCFEID